MAEVAGPDDSFDDKVCILCVVHSTYTVVYSTSVYAYFVYDTYIPVCITCICSHICCSVCVV
jgi:hypothetical protein